ncbi:10442_t:CDS:2, partial [Acaulospora colombiana]
RATKPVLGHRQPFSLAVVKSLLVDLTLVPFGHRQPFSLADEPKPDHELARRWEKERSHKQVHLHQPTINGTVSGPINGAYVSGGTVGTVNGTGTISGGTFGDYHEELQRKQARIDGENLQPIYNVQIPPPRVVTPPHPPRTTPEHQIFSSSSIISPTTRSETDNFSDLQIEQFSGDTLVDFHKYMRNTYIVKTKVAQGVKTIFRECIETALDEDLGLKEAERSVERLFTKSFDNPIDQKRTKNIPVKPFKDHLSEGTLTANIISPVLRFFFHDASIHPAIWPNTASVSSKIRKLADLDPSRAKQPGMIGNIVNNNKSKYELCLDALDLLIKKTGKDHMIFAWQTIGLYIMFDTGETELPKSFQTCGQFINGIDNLFTFTEKYENEVQRLRDYINKKKENGNVPVEIINRLRATLRTPQFKEIVKRK